MRQDVLITATLALFLLITPAVIGDDGLSTADLEALSLRSIGPALMGGRIADIAVDPRDSSTWYLAVGSPALFAEIGALEARLCDSRTRLQGDPTRARFEEPTAPSILTRASRLTSLWEGRQAPTAAQRETLALASELFEAFRSDLVEALETTLPALEAKLEAAGAPWTPGRELPE